MALKTLPPIGKFKRRKYIYDGKAVIGENGGNDTWLANVRVWREDHEKTWNYRYSSATFLTPKNGIAYDPKSGEAHGFPRMMDAYQALEDELAKQFA